MKINFNINYRANWGQSLYILGNINELGSDDENNAIKMSLNGFDNWFLNIEVPESTKTIDYRFILKSDDNNIIREWGINHSIELNDKIENLLIISHWQTQPFNKHYYSSAFTNSINNHNRIEQKRACIKSQSAFISVLAPNIASDEVLAISGNTKDLGNWDIKKALEMNCSQFPKWEINVPINKGVNQFDYKFLILKKDTKKLVGWENINNRTFNFTLQTRKDSITIEGLNFENPKGNWKGAGVAVPVFSLRSNEDFGVGDFYDLYKLIDWAVETGQNFVQILPINDTTMTHTWTDSYPYNANSTFALHPMFIRPEAIGELSDKEKLSKYESIKSKLNSLKEIDYEKVNNTKNQYLNDLYEEFGKKVLKQKAFKTFIENNKNWLPDYAAFCVLRDIYNTPDFSKWGEYSKYDKTKVEKLISENSKRINFIYFVQYFLDKQLSEVRNYAHNKNVVLKGDIPIGISRTSADAWVFPKLFHMDCQAGAPPDDFSVLGQNWGFPTYNWEEMSKDGFKWWKSRFQKMAQYFDAYRIDHILGFFRIWEIPMNAVHGLLGTFNPALPFTADELRYQYDFWINTDIHTKPFIREYFLYDFFGEYIDEVKNRFLKDNGYGCYELKEFVNTQKKVVEYFNNKASDEKNNKIKDALLGLIDQVLFIEDKEKPGYYHPRISAQFTYVYRSLSDYEKWCFDRLYNDFFYHRHNDFWYGKAMWKLPPLINSTNMLVCGEDLGMIPDCVAAVMNSQQILSLEIQRMPKDPKLEFGNTYHYPYLSVGTTSTHDMSGIRGWWEENREKTQHFYNNVLCESGNAPYFAEPWICDRILSLHLNSPSMLAIIPLQDLLSIDGDIRRNNPNEEQINIPANSRHYWRYRMHLTLEELLNSKDFNTRLKGKIKASGR